MRFDFYLIDADDTVLDFGAAEKKAFFKTVSDFGYESGDGDYETYKDINHSLWKAFELGKITMTELRERRFGLFFQKTRSADAPENFSAAYESNLSLFGDVFDDGVRETLAALSLGARLFIISNGIAEIQEKRLKSSGLAGYFEKCFLSSVIGCRKPDKRFFDFVEANIAGFDKSRALVVGDSLTADIPAAAFGYKTCYINRKKLPALGEYKPDYIITRFDELANL